MSSTREKKEEKEKELQKNVGAPKTEIIVPGYSCVPSANFVETLGMTNLRTRKMLIASLAGKKSLDKIDKKGKSLYAVQIQTSLMHPVTKQLKPQF